MYNMRQYVGIYVCKTVDLPITVNYFIALYTNKVSKMFAGKTQCSLYFDKNKICAVYFIDNLDME